MRSTTSTGPPRSAVAEDPRISTRRRDVKRSKVRRRLWIAGSIVLVLALCFGMWVALHRSWFSAKTIVVHGASHETSTQVIAAGGLASHPPLISISPGAVAAGVERLAWVKSALVTKRWPSSVMITVTDRTPVGTVADAKRWLLVDSTGRILEILGVRPFAQLRLVVPKPHLVVAGGTLGPGAQPAVIVAGSLPAAFRGQVAAVIGHPDGTVSLRLTSPVTVLLGTATQLQEKYEDIASVIAGATLTAGDVLDVSVPQASTITGH